MELNLDKLENDFKIAKEEIATIKDLDFLQKWKKQFLGENSLLVSYKKNLPSLSNEQKITFGKKINEYTKNLNIDFSNKLEAINLIIENNKLKEETQDLTISTNNQLGAIHPIQSLIFDVEKIFKNIGWEVVYGPEIEASSYNFDALNFPDSHPSRNLQDTFYLDSENESLLLRTHTSPVQIRTLLKNNPPLYIISPGRVFRSDSLDATHTPVFHQLEGLVVDENISMADLIGTLEYLAGKLFNNRETKIRLRPHFFPFTEPSAEVDVWFENKKGGAGWIEWGGCGMVHPNVLKAAGIDTSKYQGFAFGMGLERTLQFRNGINNMRNIVEGDIRFSKPFGV